MDDVKKRDVPEPGSTDGSVERWDRGDEISLLDVMYILARRRFVVFWITFLFCLAGLVASIVMPPQYEASVVMLLPKRGGGGLQNLLGALDGALGGAGGGLASLAVGKKGNEYVGMLKSRSVEDLLLDRFAPPDWRKMVGLGKETTRWKLAREHLGEMEVKVDENNLIEVTVSHRDPEMSAKVANAYVEALRTVAGRLFLTEASQKRLYLEQELNRAKEALARAEAEMRRYQEEKGVYVGDAQLKANVESRVSLRAAIAQKNIELKALMTYATPQHPDAVRIRREIAALNEELRRLEARSSNMDPLNPEGGMPAATFEYLSRYRDLKFNEEVYQSLLKMYEVVRRDETADPVIIQVVDEAAVPDQRSKPKRMLMVIMSLFLGLFVGIFAAFLVEFVDNASQDPQERTKIQIIREALKPTTYIRHVLGVLRIRR